MRVHHAVAVAVAALVLPTLTGVALAVSSTMGNPATNRQTADTFNDFTIVDTNSPAPFDGTFDEIAYYAERPGTIKFVVVDDQDRVTWKSELVSAAPGAATLPLATPVAVTAGSNLGVYSQGYGVISYDLDGSAAPAPFEANRAGEPEVGEQLAYVNDSKRVYSMNATLTASSKDVCKNGGWSTYGYKNQGQCVASVVAHPHAGR